MNAFRSSVTRISAQSLLDVLKGLLFVGRNVGASVGVAIVSLSFQRVGVACLEDQNS